MKGIVLAGGTGSRLWPITRSVSKQLLPVYDKPMIFYPISTLLLAGIREILIITTPHDLDAFKELLGDGSELGISFEYETQPEPKGLAQAFTLGETFLAGDSCLMILGDNIFHGSGLGRDVANVLPAKGAHIFTYEVSNPSEYGVLKLGGNGKPESVTEKPEHFVSDLAVTGMYFFDSRVVDFANRVSPSLRGELEITSIISEYLELGELSFTTLSRGSVWLDTGNTASLHDAASYVRVIEDRTGLKIGCLEEIAWRNSWLTDKDLLDISEKYGSSQYGKYLRGLVS
jgi:glucose-1-phosphate thymidylyltransferase